MLAGLLFLGVIAATAMPDLMEVLRGSADDDADPSETETSEDASAAESLLEPGSEEASDAEPESEGYDLFTDPAPGVTLVEAFQPGADSLTVAVPDDASDFNLVSDPENGTSSLGFTTDAGTVEIRFEGLDDVPVDDIFLRVSDAGAPDGLSDIALSAVIDGPATDEDGEEGDVLSPEDPEIQEDVANPSGDPEHVLQPEDPTIDDGPAPPGETPGDVLLPVMDDIAPEPDPAPRPGTAILLPASETDGSSAGGDLRVQSDDPQPAAESDASQAFLSPDANDGADLAAMPGALDTFWLYPDGTGPDVAEVDGFIPGADVLQISLAMTEGGGVVEVDGSPDGQDSVVRIDGRTVAVLRGAPGITFSDIFVESRPEIFA